MRSTTNDLYISNLLIEVGHATNSHWVNYHVIYLTQQLGVYAVCVQLNESSLFVTTQGLTWILVLRNQVVPKAI